MRERSTSELTKAIRSEADDPQIDAYILERAQTVLNVGYIPDWTAQERAAVLDEFRKALRDFPKWAIVRAFDEWVRTSPRRPSPGEIVVLARKAVRPITDELAHRQRVEEERKAEEAARLAQLPTKDEADAICRSAGFTPQRMEAVRRHPMARSVDEAMAIEDGTAQPHWTETTPPEHPDHAQLRAARDRNPLVQEARRAAARAAMRDDPGDDAVSV